MFTFLAQCTVCCIVSLKFLFSYISIIRIVGYNWMGDLIFTYGSYGKNVSPVINPRGVHADPFGHILIGDIVTHSVSMRAIQQNTLHHEYFLPTRQEIFVGIIVCILCCVKL